MWKNGEHGIYRLKESRKRRTQGDTQADRTAQEIGKNGKRNRGINRCTAKSRQRNMDSVSTRGRNLSRRKVWAQGWKTHGPYSVYLGMELEGPGGVRTLDAQVSRVEISPLALNVWISGEELVLHHGPDRPQPSETFYFCDSTQEVLAFDADGQPIAMRAGMEGMGGGGCSGYNESEGYIWLSCGFGGLIDVNRVAKIVVNGVEIPVRP